MITSQSISPNVLPGLVKAVEKYIIVYNTDKVLKAASVKATAMRTGSAVAGTVTSTTKGPLRLKGSKITMESNGTPKPKAPEKEEKRTITYQPKTGPSPRLDIPKEGVSLEPTWIHVTTEVKGMQIIGVKVIPFRVRSTENLLNILMSDKQVKYLDYMTTKYGRVAMRSFFRFIRALRIPRIKDLALTGDPKFDLLWGGTRYGSDMFICLSQLDMDNSEDVFGSPYFVRRIQKLGWTSIMIADDVNKRVTFCMKEFGGVCSVVPYGFLYSSLGRDHSKVFEDLEDVKRSASPFFRMSARRRKVFGETMAHNRLMGYLDTIQEEDLEERKLKLMSKAKKFIKDPLKAKALKTDFKRLQKLKRKAIETPYKYAPGTKGYESGTRAAKTAARRARQVLKRSAATTAVVGTGGVVAIKKRKDKLAKERMAYQKKYSKK